MGLVTLTEIHLMAIDHRRIFAKASVYFLYLSGILLLRHLFFDRAELLVHILLHLFEQLYTRIFELIVLLFYFCRCDK